MQTLPTMILAHFEPFRAIFLTQKTYLKAVIMLVGALMCRGGRTVCSILRMLGLKGERAFSTYHHVLNRSRWNALKASRILLEQLDSDKEQPLRIIVDGHLERRRGPKISAKGHYRDPVQSSDKYTVISSGLKWLSVVVVKRYSWFKRALALPCLTALIPSEEGDLKNGKRHKTMQEWTRQIIIQLRRWCPKRKIIFIADNEFATADIALTCSKYKVSFVSRLKLNSRLYGFPFSVRWGRPRNKGLRLPTPQEKVLDASLDWKLAEVNWYGGKRKQVQYITETCLWHVMSHGPIKIRYVLMKDPRNQFKPVLLMSTDEDLSSIEIIESYVSRWNIEVTFHEAREHLGIETQQRDMMVAI